VRPLTYAGAGVDYEALDAFKRACQEAARSTVGALAGRDLREPPGVRGESAYLLETDDGYLAHVEEGLGTKNLIADAMFDATGESFYRHVGIDTVATIVNDLVTCGAEPAIVATPRPRISKPTRRRDNPWRSTSAMAALPTKLGLSSFTVQPNPASKGLVLSSISLP
jgi:hypothetical protein